MCRQGEKQPTPPYRLLGQAPRPQLMKFGGVKNTPRPTGSMNHSSIYRIQPWDMLK